MHTLIRVCNVYVPLIHWAVKIISWHRIRLEGGAKMLFRFLIWGLHGSSVVHCFKEELLK